MLVLAGLIGIVPLAAASAPVTIAATPLPWWVPLLGLVLVSAALAYLTGIEAVRRLGSSIASFVALSEVILAVVFAALLLGQIPTPSSSGRWRADPGRDRGRAEPSRGRNLDTPCGA